LGLFVVSGFLLPLPDKSHRGKVFNFLRDYMLHANFPAYVVVDELHEEDKVEKRVPGSSFGRLATGPGFILTDCDHAVAISAGIKFKGVQGPGVIFTGFGDQVMRTIDLRPQLRAFPVEALTKDGIKIRVLAFTPFKIDARGRQPRLGEPLPYNKGAAFRAVHAQKIEHEGSEKKQCSWGDLPRMIAERTLQNIISEYNFDDLYGPYQPGGEPPRKAIAGRFYEQAAAKLEPLGIQLIGGGISDLEPANPQVYVERVRSWQAEWARKIMLRQAEGQAEWLRMVERARAEAQADLILNMGRQLEELSAARTELRPETALNLLVSILDELMRQQPTLGQILPGETLQVLTGIRAALTE
jgi:regulator of protease activity HflC (stomatin/prohibitin superfamily)